MNPFNNSFHQQFLHELYANAAYYPSPCYYVAPESVQPFRNPVSQFFLVPSNESAAHPLLQPDSKANDAKYQTKPTKSTEKHRKQSQILSQSFDQSSQSNENFKLRQKYGRNINSNIFHLMIKRFFKDAEFNGIIESIIKKYQLRIPKQQFSQLLRKKVHKLKIYVSLKKMKQFWFGVKSKNSAQTEQKLKEQQFSKIFRIISKIYLKFHHVKHVFSSMKIKSASKKLHVSGARKILQLMI